MSEPDSQKEETIKSVLRNWIGSAISARVAGSNEETTIIPQLDPFKFVTSSMDGEVAVCLVMSGIGHDLGVNQVGWIREVDWDDPTDVCYFQGKNFNGEDMRCVRFNLSYRSDEKINFAYMLWINGKHTSVSIDGAAPGMPNDFCMIPREATVEELVTIAQVVKTSSPAVC